jgi:hypothetical protein
MGMAAPLQYLASSLAKKAAAATTSDTVPIVL